MKLHCQSVKEKHPSFLRPAVAVWAATQGVALASAIATAFLMTGCGYSGITTQAEMIQPAGVAIDKTQHRLAQAGPWPDVAWWKQYGDPGLDQLMDEALTSSPSLGIAEARLRRANALAGLAQSAARPNLVLEGQSIREKFTQNYIYPPPLGGAVWTTDVGGLNFSWELDFWGKNAAAIDAAHSQVLAQQADRDAAQLALTTSLARSWFVLQRLDALRDVTEAAIRQREEILSLTRQRVSAGLDTKVELREAEAILPSTRVELSQIDENIEIVRHQIAALLGQGPDRGLDLPKPVAQAGDVVALPESLPANLIGRRPDLAAARWRVQAAQGEIDVAKAQFYPNINIAATANLISISNNLFLRSTSQDESIGPAISLPLFTGHLRSNLRAKDAEYDAAVEQYNAAVIDAFRDVADEVSSLRSLQRQRTEQALALEKTEQAYALATQRYRAGLGNYLTVLTAETSVLQQRRADTEMKARLLDLNVNLVRALGGGYDATNSGLAQR
jgi:NodT family efflux transporter outer membrane factor (OMF) lipoprotein